jgi:hypothetical protein
MLRYTARNGTTFHFDPASAGRIQVISAEDDDPLVGEPVALDLEDLREFLQHLDDRAEALEDLETDADCTAVGPD